MTNNTDRPTTTARALKGRRLPNARNLDITTNEFRTMSEDDLLWTLEHPECMTSATNRRAHTERLNRKV
jgi:hypothetical protein